MRDSSGAKLEESAGIFAALGDPTRLRLVHRLSAEGPLSITQLTERSVITRQAITKHLRLLETAGLVRGEREGREVIWQIEERRMEIAREYLAEVSKRWDKALSRLRGFVED